MEIEEKTNESTDDSTEKTAEHTKETSAEHDKTGSEEEGTEKTEGSTDQEKIRADEDKTDWVGDTSENTNESKEKTREEDNKMGKTEESAESETSRVEEDESEKTGGSTEKTSATEQTKEDTEMTRVEDDKAEDTEESKEKTTAEDDETEQTDENSERREMLSKGIADLQERRAALIEKHLKDGVQESLKFGSAENHLGTMLSGQMSVMFIINNLRTAVESRSRRKEQLKKKQAKLESQVGELRTVLDDKDRLIKEKEEDLQKIQAGKEAEESKDGDSQTDFDQSLESVDPTSQEHAEIEALKSDIEDKKLQRALLYEQAACMASDKSWKEHEVEFLDSLLNAIKDNPDEKEMKGKKKSVMAWTLLNEYRKAEHELDVLKYKDHVLEKENEELERELAFLKKIGTGEDFDDERQLRDSIDDIIEAVKEAQTQTEEDSGRGSTSELWHHGANEGRKKQLPPLRKKPQKPVWRY
ncbi:hypothetical protein Bbelb_060490 [Branchiostoma belcheri]|nr:hypothetical protein Bbelb_060490 [Branchiostoma belcheri]